MKQCPQCKTSYTDETLQYCLQDGTSLIPQTIPDTQSPTVAFSEQTQAFETNDLNERFTTNKDADQVRIHVPPPSQTEDWGKSEQTKVIMAQPNSGGSKMLIAVLATAFVMLLLFGAGIGAYLYFSNSNGEVAQDANKNRKENSESNKELITETSPTPTPTKESTPEKTTPEIEPTEKPEPTVEPPKKFNPEEVKKEVASRVYAWQSLAESRNLNAYMSNYASKIDYYTKRGVSINSVRIDKQKAFTKYDDIEINISRMSISTDPSGEKATAVFDKQWFFDGPTKSSEGKVRSELKFARIGGDWKIISERDLKVYYVDR